MLPHRLMLSADRQATVGRSSADRKTMQLKKVIGVVCFMLRLRKKIQSADKFFVV